MFEIARPSILLIEDSDEDYEVLQIIFKRKRILNPLIRLAVGDEVLAYLSRLNELSQALPCLIILDLNIIGIDGREVLRLLKQHELFKTIPVIVYSTSAHKKDVETCYLTGANSFSVKPVDFAKLEDFVEGIKIFWLQNVIPPP